MTGCSEMKFIVMTLFEYGNWGKWKFSYSFLMWFELNIKISLFQDFEWKFLNSLCRKFVMKSCEYKTERNLESGTSSGYPKCLIDLVKFIHGYPLQVPVRI